MSNKSKKKTYVPYCKFCLKYVYYEKSELTKHALTKQHIKASSEIEKKSGSIEKLLTVGSHSKEIEQRICIFLAEHNLPLRLADSLTPLFRKLLPKDQALAGVTLGKQKASNILRHNFSLVLQNQLVELLKTTFFSVIIDETTDRTIDKQLAIMVVFPSEKDLKLHVEVLDMVMSSDGLAEGLTNRIKQVIEENSIPWQIIFGFCADTTNVMFWSQQICFNPYESHGATHLECEMLMPSYSLMLVICLLVTSQDTRRLGTKYLCPLFQKRFQARDVRRISGVLPMQSTPNSCSGTDPLVIPSILCEEAY